MNTGKYVFAQLLDFVDLRQFNKYVRRYGGQKRIRKLSCAEQLRALLFGQLSGRESLRDIVYCLGAHCDKLYRLGFKLKVARNTLAKANELRDWRIYRDFAQYLINVARKLYTEDPELEQLFEEAVYLIDATMFDLCRSIFDWAKYKKGQSSVKLHMQLDLHGSIPAFFDITPSIVNDVNFLDKLTFETGAYYVFDRGYLDFKRWYEIHCANAFFVTRVRCNTKMYRRYSRQVDKSIGLRCDQTVVLTGKGSFVRYPETLRRIKFVDPDTGKMFVFITNDFKTDVLTITLLYKHRWRIELFFKWIKQHLKIRSYWGTSANAVKTQICVALCAYLIVAIARKRLGIERNLYTILQILQVSLLDKKPLFELFTEAELQTDVNPNEHQARLKGF